MLSPKYSTVYIGSIKEDEPDLYSVQTLHIQNKHYKADTLDFHNKYHTGLPTKDDTLITTRNFIGMNMNLRKINWIKELSLCIMNNDDDLI